MNMKWVYEDKDSLEPEHLDVRCLNCYETQTKYEKELTTVIENYEYDAIC